MSIDSLLSSVFVVLALYVYAALARQISARGKDEVTPPAKAFGLPEAILAVLIFGLMARSVVAVLSAKSPPHIRTADLVMTAVISLALLLVITSFLRFRGFDVDVLAGFSRIGIGRVISTAAVLLLAAYPLIGLADAVTQRVLRTGSGRQELVEMFNTSPTLQQRIAIIVLAVAVAPLAEEFLFRFFLYGVVRRYAGRLVGIAVNAALFAAVHTHLPSFGPLFVLGGCLTLAYEWSGSILVPMAMHALFNALSLTALAFPEAIPQ